VFLKTLFTTLAAGATLGAATLAAAPASAARFTIDGDTVTVRVPIDDLNLRSDTGATIALRRIHNAAGFICGEEPQAMLLAREQLYRQCMKATVDRAVARLDAPLVSAMNAPRQAGPNTLAAAGR
jgi:UrcA family protein